MGKLVLNGGASLRTEDFQRWPEFDEREIQAIQELCPVPERACAYEAIWLDHRLFLGTKKDMDDIADAFIKVREHIDELM